jgi:hypothetical protein
MRGVSRTHVNLPVQCPLLLSDLESKKYLHILVTLASVQYNEYPFGYSVALTDGGMDGRNDREAHMGNIIGEFLQVSVQNTPKLSFRRPITKSSYLLRVRPFACLESNTQIGSFRHEMLPSR